MPFLRASQALGDISADLDERTDPALLQRAADFFIDHKQYDKAVNLLIVGKQFEAALDLIEKHNVHLTVGNQLQLHCLHGLGMSGLT